MLLLLTVLLPIAAGTAVSLFPMNRSPRRTAYAAVLFLTDILALASMFYGAPLRLLPLAGTLDLFFTLDGVGLWFLCWVLVLYTAVCFYAFEYMTMEGREESFFAFYFISFGAVIAACMAGNLVTLYLCFELATLSSMPMVLHERTKEAIAAALKYLFYSIGGALLGLLAVVVLCWYGAENANAFVPGGFLTFDAVMGRETLLRWITFCGIVGFGAKAGMYPLHGWLPAAHPIAPAPASALLSGIIAKLGILAVIRLVFFSAGADLLRGSVVQAVWMWLAMLTIFMGSMMAWKEKIMKKRLAYSSISQIAYIMLGLSLLNPSGFIGGLLQLAAHACAKGTLFLCAGVFIFRLGKRQVPELYGIGKQLPLTMGCFLTASLSLIGIPPMGGFVSKWYLATGAAGNGMGILSILPPVILMVSALLTAGYLLPVVVDAFFTQTAESGTMPAVKNEEPSVLMAVPMLLLCGAALAVGVFGSVFADTASAAMQGLF